MVLAPAMTFERKMRRVVYSKRKQNMIFIFSLPISWSHAVRDVGNRQNSSHEVSIGALGFSKRPFVQECRKRISRNLRSPPLLDILEPSLMRTGSMVILFWGCLCVYNLGRTKGVIRIVERVRQ